MDTSRPVGPDAVPDLAMLGSLVDGERAIHVYDGPVSEGDEFWTSEATQILGANAVLRDVNVDGRLDYCEFSADGSMLEVEFGPSNRWGTGTADVIVDGTLCSPEYGGAISAIESWQDVTGDGHPELWIQGAAECGGPQFLPWTGLGNAALTLGSGTSWVDGRTPLVSVVSDQSGDGKPDLVVRRGDTWLVLASPVVIDAGTSSTPGGIKSLWEREVADTGTRLVFSVDSDLDGNGFADLGVLLFDASSESIIFGRLSGGEDGLNLDADRTLQAPLDASIPQFGSAALLSSPDGLAWLPVRAGIGAASFLTLE